MSHFEKWMQEAGLSLSSIKKYAGAITGVMSQWSIDNNLCDTSLTEITTVDEFDIVANELEALSIFIDRNSTGHHMYSSALKKFREYLISIPADALDSDINAIVESNELNITEKLYNIKIRIGQGKFRGKLINYWKSCSISGFPDVGLLVASHIKPWSASTDDERTDLFNGLLLLPNLDRAFDLGYITFDESGKIVISKSLRNHASIGISSDMKLNLTDSHQTYMEHHRFYQFEKFKST